MFSLNILRKINTLLMDAIITYITLYLFYFLYRQQQNVLRSFWSDLQLLLVVVDREFGG